MAPRRLGFGSRKTGVFAPPVLVGPVPFADLQAMIGRAGKALEAPPPEDVNGWADKSPELQIGPRKFAFTSETRILSFSVPNFHLHAATAYDILRSRGVPLGKRDFGRHEAEDPAFRSYDVGEEAGPMIHSMSSATSASSASRSPADRGEEALHGLDVLLNAHGNFSIARIASCSIRSVHRGLAGGYVVFVSRT